MIERVVCTFNGTEPTLAQYVAIVGCPHEHVQEYGLCLSHLTNIRNGIELCHACARNPRHVCFMQAHRVRAVPSYPPEAVQRLAARLRETGSTQEQ